MDAPRGSGIPKFLIWIPAVLVGMLVLGWLIQILGISGPTWIWF